MRNQVFLWSFAGLALAGCQQQDSSPQADVERLEADLAANRVPAPVTEFGFLEAMEHGPSFSLTLGDGAESAASMAEGNARADAREARETAPPDAQIAYAYS